MEIDPISLGEKMGRLFSGGGRLSFVAGLADEMPETEWFLVGGAVRDALLERSGRVDYDLVVRGITLKRLRSRLDQMGKVNLVGKSFGVLKFAPRGHEGEPVIDIAWPRTEQAGMSGAYRDFSVMTDPDLPLESDLSRRDFTVNALAWDVRNRRLIDRHDGLADLKSRKIRAVGQPSQRFQEDLSRVLRGVRFACELGFEVESGTWEAIRQAAPRLDDRLPDGRRVVPPETVAKEMLKSLSADPQKAVDLLDRSGVFQATVPELMRLKGCPQTPPYHTEGDAWQHTKMAIASFGSPEFSRRFSGQRPSACAILGLLFHDIGKPLTMTEREGRMTFWGHAESGARVVEDISRRLRFSSVPGFGIREEDLSELVSRHMFVHLVNLDEVRKTTLQRYYLSDERLGRDLLHIGFADTAASLRQDGKPDFDHFDRLLAEIERIRGASTDGRLVTGSDLIRDFSLAPGPEVGRLLAAVREEQLRGGVATAHEAKEFLRRLVG